MPAFAPYPSPVGAPADDSGADDNDDGSSSIENSLEFAIGREVRDYRTRMDMTVVDLAKQADLSAGMLSKIENGQTSPSLATLQRLSTALNVPVTSFFRKFEEQREATHIPAGEGLTIERRGTRAGHQYQLLGHTVGQPVVLEPYMVTMTADSEVFPVFKHAGLEFIYMVEGEVSYRHGNKLYDLKPGDSLFFDADAPHGPEDLRQVPARMLSVIVYPRQQA